MRYHIYGLVNTWTGHVIYVGQTIQPLAARLAQARHEWKKRKDARRKHFAITGVYAMGGKLAIIELDHAYSQAEADKKEMWWIDFEQSLGYAWGNTSQGGPGNWGVARSVKNREAISRSLKRYYLNKSSNLSPP